MKKIILLISLALALNSCFKEDSAVSPFDRGDVTSNQINLNGKYYEDQVYFDLSSNSVVRTNKFGEWDLGFQTYDSYFIMLNSARVMAVQDLGEVEFESVTKALAKDLYVRDVPNGNMDSSAIGKWWVKSGDKIVSKNHVYIVDRGTSNDGKKSGVRKMKILGATEAGFTIIFSELNATDIDTVFIPRIENRNYNTFSFDDGGKVNDLEPPADTWDIVFTKYTELFDVVGFEVYPVTGALLNVRNCKVAELDSLSDFSTITSDAIQTANFTKKRDEIGYDWKDVDINTGVYTVKGLKKYLVKDTDGFVYKLRFIGFQKIIEGKAEKGFPEFEIKLL